MKTASKAPAEIDYPESDGKPMAESDVHRDWMVRNISRLGRRFAGQRVYVSGNLLIYYVEGNPRKSFAPDTFVVKDCDPVRRRVFKVWEEGRGPNFVLETTSRKTKRADQVTKKELYAQLRIPEYFLYDPLAEWLTPPLQGYRLSGDEYVRIEPAADGGIASAELGVTFRLEDGQLAMFDTASGERVLCGDERAEAEAARADLERERAEHEKQRAAAEKRQAEIAWQQADEAKRRLAEETAARQALEAELRRLKSGGA